MANPIKRIGVLTGGGDCPGLNPVIRAIVRKSYSTGLEVIGIKNGWKGLIQKDTMTLDLQSVSGILPKGGTILGTSRTNPYKDPQSLAALKANLKDLQLDAVIAIGGEDTLGASLKLFKEGLKVIGIPKTIDNDLSETDYTFGFDTAVNTAMESIDRLHTTAESHHRIMVVETMGRNAGWIALESGIAGGANSVLIPEIPFQLEAVERVIEERATRGRRFSIVVVAEGARPVGGAQIYQEAGAPGKLPRLGGIGQQVTDGLAEATGRETRCTVLGHLQRGGSPTPFDRLLATRFGVRAVQCVVEHQMGMMVALRGQEVLTVPIAEAVATRRQVPTDGELVRAARELGISLGDAV